MYLRKTTGIMDILEFFSTIAGGITEVKTDIFVTSFGPVSDVKMVRYPFHKSCMC